MKKLVSEFSGSCAYTVEIGPAGLILRTQFEVNETHPHTDGHFDNWKILPGISQVGMVLRLVGAHLDSQLQLKRIKRAKFSGMICPPSKIKVEVTLTEQDRIARWVMKDSEQVFSSGSLEYV